MARGSRRPEHPADGRAVRRRRPDRARRLQSETHPPAARARQDHRVRHARHRRGVPARRPGRHPARGRQVAQKGSPARSWRTRPTTSSPVHRRTTRGNRELCVVKGRGRPRIVVDSDRARAEGVLVERPHELGCRQSRASSGAHCSSHLPGSAPSPIVLRFVVSVPIGWVAFGTLGLRGALCHGASLYAIPSLGLLVIRGCFLGTGLLSPVNLIVALTLYGVAIMVRTTAGGPGRLRVRRRTRNSATAVGFSSWTRFWRESICRSPGRCCSRASGSSRMSTVSLVTVGAVLGFHQEPRPALHRRPSARL